MADLLRIPDVSEYQTVDFNVFSGPIIVRAHNSTRADLKWPEHAAGASRQSWWGAYQYLKASVDPAAAARALIDTLGEYRPNVTILDLEEGDGDQSSRQHAWLEVMATHAAADWTYSGLYFARSHGVDPVQFLAAYQSNEPTDAHLLWQFSSGYSFSGISSPTDASVFHGSLQDLVALTNPTPTPSPTPPKDEHDMKTPVSCWTTDDGHFHVIIKGTDSALWVREFNGAAWAPWVKLGGAWLGQPDVNCRGDRIDIIGEGVDKSVYHVYRTAGKWSAIEPLGGAIGDA